VQVVGANCAVCAAKIVMAREGRACASCDVPLHNGCAEGHVCDASAKPAAAAARTAAVDTRPPAQRYRWVIIAGERVTVASIVVPWFRHWRTERAIASAPRTASVATSPTSRSSAARQRDHRQRMRHQRLLPARLR
jgi:hypothetical protein